MAKIYELSPVHLHFFVTNFIIHLQLLYHHTSPQSIHLSITTHPNTPIQTQLIPNPLPNPIITIHHPNTPSPNAPSQTHYHNILQNPQSPLKRLEKSTHHYHLQIFSKTQPNPKPFSPTCITNKKSCPKPFVPPAKSPKSCETQPKSHPGDKIPRLEAATCAPGTMKMASSMPIVSNRNLTMPVSQKLSWTSLGEAHKVTIASVALIEMEEVPSWGLLILFLKRLRGSDE